MAAPNSPQIPSQAARHGGPEADAVSSREGLCTGLGVAITAMNSGRTLQATLSSVAALTETVVVIDSGSTDGSLEIARACGARVEHHPWAGHVAQKQHALDRCVALRPDLRWLLLLDSDEAVDTTLAASIRRAVDDPSASPAGYEINRTLLLHGQLLTHTFQPEWRLRLFRVGKGRVSGTPPHDTVSVDGPVARLAGSLLHDSWRDSDDMLRRSAGYARISAEQLGPNAGGGGLLDILVRPGAAFFKQYLLRGGVRDGWRGLVASGGAAASTLMKHIAIAERKGLSAERSSKPTAAEPPSSLPRS